MIARPHGQANPSFFLQTNSTIETIDFTSVGGPIPNRGSTDKEMCVHAVHYIQKVSDFLSRGALHIEPGFWLNIPANDNEPPQLARQASIPHGTSLLALSTATLPPREGSPEIQPVYAMPFIDQNIPALHSKPQFQISTGQKYMEQFEKNVIDRTGLPDMPGITDAQIIDDPTLVLQAANKRQEGFGSQIVKTSTIVISTAAKKGSTGLLNIPFVVDNANAVQMDAVFWIETVRTRHNAIFLQLQYVQRVILDFPQLPGARQLVHWPHVSVSTLVKQ